MNWLGQKEILGKRQWELKAIKMPLFRHNNIGSILESEMESGIVEYLKKQEFTDINLNPIKLKFFRQIHDLRASRISDIIIQRGNQLINIECKLNDVGGVLKQAEDHLMYCDYSYIAMPSRTYIPTYYQKLMIEKGIGLFLWDIGNKILLEAIYAKYNRLDKWGKMHKKEKLETLKQVELMIYPPKCQEI